MTVGGCRPMQRELEHSLAAYGGAVREFAAEMYTYTETFLEHERILDI